MESLLFGPDSYLVLFHRKACLLQFMTPLMKVAYGPVAMWTLVMHNNDSMTNIWVHSVVQLPISNTNVNRHSFHNCYMQLWNEHMMANLLCNVLLDAEIMKNVTTSKFSKWK